MRLVALGLGMAVLVLALTTAGWRAEAHRTAGENEGLERQISQLSRARDVAREEVDRLRQPFAVRLRSVDLSKNSAAGSKGKNLAAANLDTKKSTGAKSDVNNIKSAKEQQKRPPAGKSKIVSSTAKGRVLP